jgi:hypothetical protein
MMGRMLRRLLNLLTALSLLLCVAVVVLWVRSNRGRDQFQRHRWLAADRVFHEDSIITAWGIVYLRLWREEHGGPSSASHIPYGYARRGDTVSRWSHSFEGHGYSGGFPLWPALRTRSEEAGFLWRAEEIRRTRKDLGTSIYACRTIGCPLWVLMAAGMLLPGWRCAVGVKWFLQRTRRRRRPGLCPSCGYDMRASPTRCSECGTKAPTENPA